MSALDRFIRANNKLVMFEQELTDAVISDSTIFSLEVHREELKSIWSTIKGLYDKCIDQLDSEEKDRGQSKEDKSAEDNEADSDSDDGNPDLDSINARLHSSYEIYVRIVSKLSSDIHMRSQTNPTVSLPSPSNFHLPACDTESFRGDYQSWPSFRDMFSAIYIRNSSLSKVQKLFHLRKKTEGEAHDIVKKCPLTNSGFDIAWSNLKDRFENKRMLVHSQLRLLFNLTTVSAESSDDIKCLQRDINSCISSLKMYDIDVSSWDAIFVYVCSTKLPRTTLSLWEQSIKNKKDLSKWEDLDCFLSSRYQTLETISEINAPSSSDKSHSNSKKPNLPLNKKVNSNHAKISSSSSNPSCSLCANVSHTIRKCPKFLNMTANERALYIKKLNLCTNCFAKAHNLKECKSSYNCFSCGKRHHTLLHRDIQQSQETSATPNIKSQQQVQKSIAQSIQSTSPQASSHPSNSEPLSFCPSTSGNSIQTCFAAHSHNVLLGTAVVQVTHLGLKYFVRALIDSGSQGSFISERIFNILKLPFQAIEAEIAGLNGVTTAKANKLANFSICPRFDSNLEVSITALVVPRLSGDLPTTSVNPSILVDFPNIQLADPQFYESNRIDLLIGADLFNNIMLENVQRNICGSLVAQETVFGWIITGPIQQNPKISSFSTVVSYLTESNLEKQLKRFWEVEEVPQKPHLSDSDSFCEKLFSDTTTRDKNGRFVVSLPFKPSLSNDSPRLGQSRSIASAQFLRNETRLLKNVDLKKQYDSVIQEYLELGHMVKVPTLSENKYPEHYYLPHHAVIKPDRTTTKVRVVFNASCPSSSGTSLNDILYPGPTLQTDLTLLLLRWRFYRFVFSADIEKMYRQIRVNPRETRFQRILFRFDSNDKIEDFELQTVTFGVNAAPYLAIRSLLQLAQDCYTSYPIASKIIRDDMYVDDVLSGCHDLESTFEARNELISALNSACFPLRKWTSNSTEFLKSLPKEHILKQDFLVFDDSSQTKTLGVKWNAMSDCFLFDIQASPPNPKYTKRQVLSEISKIFDPAGWLAPIVILAKILMRDVWLSKVDWDDDITPKCFNGWVKFLENFSSTKSIQIPRWVSYSPKCNIQFHAFCDASENAYAAAIYTRIQFEDNSVCVNLLTSKSRVSPVKSLSIPRLELCGATLLADIVESVIPSMKIPEYEVFKWTDSTIVLSWLRKPACHWKTFVANRVSLISNKVGIDNWFHVDTQSNPADLASRGVYPNELIDNPLWWHGPYWLAQPPSCWPLCQDILTDTNLEQKAIKVHVATDSNQRDIVERFSSFPRAIRVISYIFRFIYRIHPKYRNSCVNYSTDLTVDEIKNTKNRLILLTQAKYFPNVVESLRKKEMLSKSCAILNLNPFLDEIGIIRAFGRLAYSPSLSYDERYPIILPYNGHLSRLIVKFTHLLCLHGGNQQVLNLVRLQFWIPKLKNLIKSIIHQCKVCVLYKKKLQKQLMAALPPARTTLKRPFYNTGIDFSGPFNIKSFSGRGSKISKGYVCVFVCFATKAIHLEATSCLSTPAFLAAFHRFISRRGCPQNVYSDNGTNFTGASREIAKNFVEASKSNLVSHFVHQQLSWHFIPPGAPHMGGLWEAGVKSFKNHFKKISGNFTYTFEEFCTLLAKIEACMNSRPISIASEDPQDLNPLTPGHFLTGGPILAPPEPCYDTHPESVVNRWQRVKVLQQHFCQRWKMEYLKELHKRNKWKTPQNNIEIDSVVVVREENLPPSEWRIGRVTKLYPGKDNRVRVADIYTTKGVLTRPIVKLVILPTK
ncbi:uncharacterized protein LOC142225329 [Haematobia irritans]|uniref:uncharacterized protein LOC142225329 n=1 Tax=Haematobia irritans TaxID=7368 RepID=UPI003F4FFB5B